MNRRMRLYYYGVLGAIGGLIGWQISSMIGLSFTANVYLSEFIVGALIGLSVGLLIGFAEGVPTRNFPQASKAVVISGLLGALGGGLGLPLSEGFYQLLGGEPWARVLGWGVFGLIIGLASGITSGAQGGKGTTGGLLGGILGGCLLEVVRSRFSDPLLGKAVGLVLLGGAIGVFIAMIVYLLSKAWFTVTSGKLKGTDIILDKFIHPEGPPVTIGSNALKADIVFPDPDIAPQHAVLKGEGSHFNLKDMSLEGTFINESKINRARLRNNQIIRMGNTNFSYHERR